MSFHAGTSHKPRGLVQVVSLILVLLAAFLCRNSYGDDGMNARELLGSFEWNSRPIVIFGSGEASDAQAGAQLKSLWSMSDNLASRDIVLVSVQKDKVLVHRPQDASSDSDSRTYEDAALAGELRAHFEVTKGQFTVLLIGKDGSVKRRSETPVDSQSLFSQIDSMPMRQAEMIKARD